MAQAIDYFNPKDIHREYIFPDGISKLILRKLTEGDRKAISASSGKVEFNKNTEDFKLNLDSENQKVESIARAIVDWSLFTYVDGVQQPVPFNKHEVKNLVEKLDPAIIDSIYGEVVSMNAWMQGRMSKEELDKRVKLLNEQLAKEEDREKKENY